MESVSTRNWSTLTGRPLSPNAGDRIDEVVARWAWQRPGAVAVRWAGQAVTYRQLVARADEIASGLANAGVRRADIVAVQLPRSVEMVCTILGVLRVGAIYTLMPLDWPVARRREVLRLTGARLCVSGDADAFDCPQPMVSVDTLLRGMLSAPPDEHLARPADELGDLGGACCVFFTSGSTGTPKCAVAPHRGVIRVAADPGAGFDQSTVMLQSSSVAWDLFAVELWGPLLNGGTSVLRESEFFSYDDLRTAVKAGANTAFLTPTVFNGAVTDDPDSLCGLQKIFIGGEAPSPAHIRRFLDRFPDTVVCNIYGPVEATIWVTRHDMALGADVGADVPAGAPVPGTGIHLLDDDRRLVPVGELGEIAVSGEGLAYGYLGNRHETERRFPVLPIGPHGTPVRVYLTGDFGRVDELGRLRFHGRRDRQVKIIGVRVEPGEVERVVAAIPGVSAAAALPIPVGAAKPESLAVVYASGTAAGPRPDQVRAAIADTLPQAFVPRTVRHVDALPLNGNGKVDQRAIADLLAEENAGVSGPDRTPLTTLLVELEALTGVAASVDSDVVDLGLTSITALKLIARLRAVHDVRLPMNVIFRSRTPAAIADWIDQH